MTGAYVTNNAENVKPRIEESREDSTDVTSRMDDGITPGGGTLVLAEVSSRSEGVLPSRKRGPEGVCHHKDPMLEHADGSEKRTNVMYLILESRDVYSVSDRVAELQKQTWPYSC